MLSTSRLARNEDVYYIALCVISPYALGSGGCGCFAPSTGPGTNDAFLSLAPLGLGGCGFFAPPAWPETLHPHYS